MSGLVGWIGAQADEGDPAESAPDERQGSESGAEQPPSVESDASPESWQAPPPHNFPASEAAPGGTEFGCVRPQNWDEDPDLWLYRKKTTALLRRYMQWSLEAGRVPSLLGREFFRAKISAFTATTFEARVIFLHDVERCLDGLQSFDREIVARVVLQEYDHEAAARILQCNRRTLERRLPELIDELSDVFLKAELLERLPETREEIV
jgi:DNA-directed RNA polymerase specialized sigma24 family protein